MQKEQVSTTNPTPHQDEDTDMQLKAVTPEHTWTLLKKV